MNIRELIWSEPMPPNGIDVFYDHVCADTRLGKFQIEWKSWKENHASYDLYLDGFHVSTANSLAEAKELAKRHIHTTLEEILKDLVV